MEPSFAGIPQARVDEHAVEGAVVGQERGGFRTGDFAEGFFEGICWNRGIQAEEGVVKAAGEDDLQEGLALGAGSPGAMSGPKIEV